MRPCVLCAAALFALVLVVARPTWADDKKPSEDKKPSDDKKYTVKAPRPPAKGKSVKVSEKVTVSEKAKVGDMNVASKKKQVAVYVEKTLDADEKTGTRKKFSRVYESAKEYEGDESSKLPYHGRTIVAKRDGDKWELSAEGKPELGEDDLKDLTMRITEAEKPQDALYPTKPVAVGGKWALDAKEVAKFLDGPIVKVDADSIKGEGKLVKAYKKGDVQWGTIEYTITFEATLLIFKGLKSELKATVDQPLDGGSSAGKATSNVKIAGKDLAIEVATEMEATDVK